MLASPTVTALLGPTNTGKTHRAIRRMLAHRSGIIGLPLRLLAREVHARVAAEVGDGAVALVTGEERRVPPRPRYWVCTVEAMPVDDVRVDFLAVDEVQLVAHPQRGHAFTDRVLRARGRAETWLLGSDTARPLLERLLPGLEVRSHPRLSRLSWAGVHRLDALPPRSAIVAFSVDEVTRLAERVRARRGGTAVVLGALSPRARAAQVEMFQSGEVQFLVATDAIGMGLNMDVDHVAFGALSKFDGRRHRPLRPDEVAQVAGRAGRWRRGGTFGVLEGAGVLPPEVVSAVEEHRFAPLRRARWRNPDLDLSSVDALLASLERPPPRRLLAPVPDAPDHAALRALAADPEVRRRARGPDAVALLWEVCRVPDYRRTLTGEHPRLLRAIFVQLADRGRIDPDWLGPRVDRLDRDDGDVETLMARIAWVRTWTYLAHRPGWLDDARAWRERTRAVEDRLSDALHDRLVRRFVDRRVAVLVERMASGRPLEAELDEAGHVTAAGQPLGRLDGLEFRPAPAALRKHAAVLLRAARRALAPEIARRVAELEASPHEDFEADDLLALSWRGSPVGRLVGGPDPLSPGARARRLPFLDGTARAAVQRRLERWARDEVRALLGPLLDADGPPAVRGLAWRAASGLGSAPLDAPARLDRTARRALERLGLRAGRHLVFASALLEPAAVERRAVLAAAFLGLDRLPPVPSGPSTPALDGVPERFYALCGYPVLGPLAVRADLVEAAEARLRGLARRGPAPVPRGLPEQLACPEAALPAVLRALGWRRLRTGRYVRAPRRR